jgi:hypothetical protein
MELTAPAGAMIPIRRNALRVAKAAIYPGAFSVDDGFRFAERLLVTPISTMPNSGPL